MNYLVNVLIHIEFVMKLRIRFLCADGCNSSCHDEGEMCCTKHSFSLLQNTHDRGVCFLNKV